MPASTWAFPRKNRLLRPDQYSRVFAEGNKSGDRFFLVIASRNSLTYARLGLAVSKRRTRRAVDRNRLKRLIRESFRIHNALLAGLDLVVINRQVNMSLSNGDILKSLSQHWQRLVRVCKDS